MGGLRLKRLFLHAFLGSVEQAVADELVDLVGLEVPAIGDVVDDD